MSAELYQPAAEPAIDSSGTVIECGPCELTFPPARSQAEGEHLAGVHNGLHHGGNASAAAAPAVPEAVAGGVAARLGWAMDPGILEDARGQAVPFTGDKTASDRAWAARVDTAVQGMDVLDPGGVDVWAQAHADSAEPHLAEAELVSAWETWVRRECDLSTTANEAAAGHSAGRDDAELSL